MVPKTKLTFVLPYLHSVYPPPPPLLLLRGRGVQRPPTKLKSEIFNDKKVYKQEYFSLS